MGQYGEPVKLLWGNMNNIREATPEQIKGLVRRAYVPENTSIVVIGNIRIYACT